MKPKKSEKRVFFLSDIHLTFEKDSFEKEKREKLYKFLDHVRENGDVLIIAGDLFDFWYEWKHVIPKYWFEVIYRMRILIDQGIRVVFITGNHDFEFGQYLEKEVGILCFEESADLKFCNRRFFIAHGDGLAKTDRGYRFMKRVTRNRFSKFLFKLLIHPDMGMQFSKWASGTSRKLVNIDKEIWSEEYFEFAVTKFAEGYDFVILGHLHTPVVREKNGNVYLNLGDWINHFSYGYYDGKTLSLKYWDK